MNPKNPHFFLQFSPFFFLNLQCATNIPAFLVGVSPHPPFLDVVFHSKIPQALVPGCFGENLLVDENFAAKLLCVGDEIECWRGGQVQSLRRFTASCWAVGNGKKRR